MCTVSVIMQVQADDWSRRYFDARPVSPHVAPVLVPDPPPMPTSAEMGGFRRWVEAAREFDRLTGQPDCDDAEKILWLRRAADALGVDISFV
jgi:hypothetical protein